MKILVCDDDHSVRNTISIVLGAAGHQVETAIDGQDAFEKIQASSFDVLVTDNQMPRLSGVNLVDQIREFNSLIVVILISAVPIRVDSETKNRLRLNGILSKPFKANELLDCLKNIDREKK